MRPRALLCLVPFGLALADAGGAQQLPAFSDTIVITATGEAQPADAVAAATTVISSAEIEASGEATVAELLRRVTGATLLRSGQDGGVTSLFVRGTGSAQTLVLFDGVRLNSPFFGGYDWSLPLTVGTGRIEMVRGPFSALYGADAIGGVVQLVPERDGSPGAQALLEGGSARWRRAEVEAATRLGDADLVVAGGLRDGSGELANDDFSARSVIVDASFALPSGGHLGALARVSRTRTEVPFAGASATPHRNTGADETLLAVPARFSLGTGELAVTLDHVQRQVTYRDPDDPYGFVAADTDAASDGARASYRLALPGHNVTVGCEWRRDEVTDASSYGVSLAGRTITTGSLFAQDEVTVGTHLGLQVGARVDRATPWGEVFSPRAVASWRSRELRAWVSYGQAFRAPSLGELYYPLSGNAELAPERSHAAEIGVALPLAGGLVRLDAVAFRNRIVDLIDFDFATFRYANVARAAQDGIELTTAARLGRGAWLTASLTGLDARDGEGLPLLRRPRIGGSATLSGPLLAAVSGEASLVWVGSRDDIDPVTFTRVDAEAFVTVDATVAVPVGGGVTLRLRAENLADRKYEEVRGYPAPGRRLFLAAAVNAR
jgi:vitamin B12 transporter